MKMTLSAKDPTWIMLILIAFVAYAVKDRFDPLGCLLVFLTLLLPFL